MYIKTKDTVRLVTTKGTETTKPQEGFRDAMRPLKCSIHDALLRCASPHTDAPDRFITWSAFSIIGAVMKNKIFIRDGLFTLYPNQYIVLVSPPGIGKGTSIKFAWDIIKDTAPNYIANMVSDRVTAPRILERIANGWNSAVPQIVNNQVVIGSTNDHTCTIYSTELGVLIGASDWMLEFLCESWDRNEYDYDTKNKGSVFIKNMCTSLVGGTVPDYLQNMERDTLRSIKGGFTSRCLFIFESEPARDLAFPPPLESNPQSVSLKSDIKTSLEHIAQNIAGEFTYNTEARIKFENFIKPIRNNIANDPEPVANFKARIRAHTLKLAMILSVARHDTLVIEGIDMHNAIAYMQDVLRDVERVFRGAGESELASSAAKVQSYIERVGVTTKKEMLKNLHRHMTVETLDRVLFTLQTIGCVITVASGKQTLYKHRNGKGP